MKPSANKWGCPNEPPLPVTIWPYDSVAAREFGRIYAELRRIGRPMQQIDMQVAAVARTLGDCTVVTVDTDLFAVPGLSVTDWSDEA